jgi:small GTP-binding protein
VGNKRVGKTSISNRYCHGEFNEDEKSSQTVKFMKKNLTIENTSKWSQLHIWDTLGQEKFKSMSPLFFRKSVGCFLVYDVTNIESFHAL